MIKSEQDILDPATRRRIIQHINGQENRARKHEAYKRYQCYKDKTHLYVVNLLLRQFDKSTVDEMSYALSNLGICRKVIDKLARVYKYGVEREIVVDGIKDEKATEAISIAVRESDADQAMKKTNRFYKLFKNTMLYIRPMVENSQIRMTPLPPYLYDVVESSDDREKPLVVILSGYSPARNIGGGFASGLAAMAGTDGRNGNVVSMQTTFGNGIDETIADVPGDEADRGYVFWSDSYHFTCDKKGNIISTEEIENPIEKLPFVNYAEDQDGSFWAEGGEDLVDGAILINSMVTNINHIAITQGYGQLVMTGKDLPKNVKVGPNKGIVLTHESEDPVPTFEFKSANPPLDQLRSLVEMYVALLLTTNNLSTSGVASNLSGSSGFASGIAMIIDKSESMEDVEDQRQLFVDNEPVVWEIYSRWHARLKAEGSLNEELSAIAFPDLFDVYSVFGEPKAIESEKERLDVIKMKLDMGLMTQVDAIKEDNPGITRDMAEEKLKKIREEKVIAPAVVASVEPEVEAV